MQELNALIKNRFQKAPKAISERGELLQYSLDGINAGRDGKRYRRLSIGFIAKKAARVRTSRPLLPQINLRGWKAQRSSLRQSVLWVIKGS